LGGKGVYLDCVRKGSEQNESTVHAHTHVSVSKVS